MANKKSNITVETHVFNRTGKFNFRVVVRSNLKANVVANSARQGYENKSECIKIASNITYAGIKPTLIVLKKYRRV